MNMTETDSSATDYPCGQPRRHHDFYFEDGTLVMQIESVIFKVHRSILARYSTVIHSMLSVPSVEGSQDGTDENPLVMTGDSAASWEFLLGLQYNIPRNRPDALKGEGLLMILPLVHKYCMEEMETWIIEQIKAARNYDGFVDIIVASRIVGSNELYEDGLQRLLSTKLFPTLEQAERMGTKETHAVMKVAAEAAIAVSNDKITHELELKHAIALVNIDTRTCRHCNNTTNWKCGSSRCRRVQQEALHCYD
ncbi:hypothetical protein FRC14_000684 [Serendipita sp. 396]|nr:hypothetical protein FRC14_000684 [Serendipita sp. 396]KAG8773662.1 hypothetical protein FRC15_001885 [Serendipita sp. 397]KAG8812628.1 hypothetical protein FRC19_003015 [Serendipita sp. 401]KAG8845718.1 hypothetical protein FRB91_001554 [Serendipita sp. 411]KAG8870901.1 hypothetical protein FRC20_011190 [Serendipita sp. 405]KAG9052610.1 hypothetical protein FS842_009589 [Serendipita sp. 407]